MPSLQLWNLLKRVTAQRGSLFSTFGPQQRKERSPEIDPTQTQQLFIETSNNSISLRQENELRAQLVFKEFSNLDVSFRRENAEASSRSRSVRLH